MGCNCKNNRERIKQGKTDIEELRKLFIERMTVDSETQDRRKKDFNQAIFHFENNEDIDSWNEQISHYPKGAFTKKRYGATYQVWDEIDMDMVLQCFDNAVRDWRRIFCDIERCNRK